MSQQLISRSPDLKRLRDDGYEIEIRSNHLLVHAVPYVNQHGLINKGILVSDITMAGDITAKPMNHVIHWSGNHPCHKDGSIMSQISHQSAAKDLAPDLRISHSFSNKPPAGYNDYYEKITRYIEIISAPANSLDPNVTVRTFKIIESVEADSPFAYEDTATSRAGIGVLSEKLAAGKVAIVGLGGTGSYILDQLAKTPIKEIHLFDGDKFLQHNAFRAPGAASLENIKRQSYKVDYFKEAYSNMHKGIISHPNYIQSNDLGLFDYVFVCIDDSEAKKGIVDYLVDSGTPFVDVGMGIHLVDNQLLGTCRVTTGSATKNDHINLRIPFSQAAEDDAYSQNIQVADLNALNAIMAVIKWKKLCGFYQDLETEHNSTYSINVNQMTSDDLAA